MRTLITCLFLIVTCAWVNADDLFTGSNIKDLRVVDADKEIQTAWVVDKSGNQSEIYIGDAIGIEGWIVVTIEETHIELKKDKTITRIRVINNSDEVTIDDSKAGSL